MLKKDIKFKDWDGNERSGEFYFHITEPEMFSFMVDLGLTEDDEAFKAILQKIIDTKDYKELLEIFKKMVLLAYGEKSEDGLYFRKNETIRDNFGSTGAYNALYMELATNSDSAAEFMNGIFPVKTEKDQDKPTAPPASQVAQLPPPAT